MEIDFVDSIEESDAGRVRAYLLAPIHSGLSLKGQPTSVEPALHLPRQPDEQSKRSHKAPLQSTVDQTSADADASSNFSIPGAIHTPPRSFVLEMRANTKPTHPELRKVGALWIGERLTSVLNLVRDRRVRFFLDYRISRPHKLMLAGTSYQVISSDYGLGEIIGLSRGDIPAILKAHASATTAALVEE